LGLKFQKHIAGRFHQLLNRQILLPLQAPDSSLDENDRLDFFLFVRVRRIEKLITVSPLKRPYHYSKRNK
jgi:hypothetical protein